MDVEALRRRMRPERRERFDSVWRATFYPLKRPAEPSLSSSFRSCFSREHAEVLVKHNLATPAPGPGPMKNIPFNVYEDRGGGRQRFILWTRDANDRLDSEGYEADVPLHHISSYLSAINTEAASQRDFRCGFYQIEIPKDALPFFRFPAADGSWWQLTRLPMGHSCAPELMHTLAATAAGHPLYVSPEFVECDVSVDVWIDNVRYCGVRGAVRAATRRLDATQRACAITWKEADSVDLGTRYCFLGVDWNHEAGTVAPSDKLLSRLRSFPLNTPVSAAEVESLGGRLLHASAIAGVFPGSFYFSLKWIRRVVNSLNNGARTPSSLVSVPPSVQRSLSEWVAKVGAPRAIRESSGPPRYTAFVDASTKGWGAVVVCGSSFAVKVLGASWSAEERAQHINVLEAQAFRNTVELLPEDAAGTRVSFLIDNTTVISVGHKGSCVRNEALNRAVVSALERCENLSISFSLRYIRSGDNPADVPSRVDLSSFDRSDEAAVQRALWRFFSR